MEGEERWMERRGVEGRMLTRESLPCSIGFGSSPMASANPILGGQGRGRGRGESERGRGDANFILSLTSPCKVQ